MELQIVQQQLSFEFGGSTVTPPTTGGSSEVTDTTVSVQGSSDLIGYEITGRKQVGTTVTLESRMPSSA